MGPIKGHFSLLDRTKPLDHFYCGSFALVCQLVLSVIAGEVSVDGMAHSRHPESRAATRTRVSVYAQYKANACPSRDHTAPISLHWHGPAFPTL